MDKKRIEICRKARKVAANTCFESIKETFFNKQELSEVEFRNIWYKKLKDNHEVEPEGWYDPPKHGIAVLFGDELNQERVNYPSLRPKKYWPQSYVNHNPSGLGYLFACPYIWFDKVPIIGDFGFHFYLGKSQKIKDHFKKSLEVLYLIIEKVRSGLSFKQLYTISMGIIKKNNYTNNIFSITDNNWTNLGHNIPFIERDINSEEQLSVRTSVKNKINDVISHARIFINNNTDSLISDNCAITVEPRLMSIRDKKLPMCSFHTIVSFIGGKKYIFSNFEKIFKLLNMDWLN